QTPEMNLVLFVEPDSSLSGVTFIHGPNSFPDVSAESISVAIGTPDAEGTRFSLNNGSYFSLRQGDYLKSMPNPTPNIETSKLSFFSVYLDYASSRGLGSSVQYDAQGQVSWLQVASKTLPNFSGKESFFKYVYQTSTQSFEPYEVEKKS